jgi:hypothetical protein
MSVCTRAECPHKRGVFIYLADGPWLGDPADPDYGRYPYVHDTSRAEARGALEVCELMPFATPEEAGEVRAWADGKPMWSLRLACGCDVLTHYVPMAGTRGFITCTAVLAHQSSYRIESVTPVSVEAPARPAVQLALFGGAA